MNTTHHNILSVCLTYIVDLPLKILRKLKSIAFFCCATRTQRLRWAENYCNTHQISNTSDFMQPVILLHKGFTHYKSWIIAYLEHSNSNEKLLIWQANCNANNSFGLQDFTDTEEASFSLLRQSGLACSLYWCQHTEEFVTILPENTGKPGTPYQQTIFKLSDLENIRDYLIRNEINIQEEEDLFDDYTEEDLFDGCTLDC